MLIYKILLSYQNILTLKLTGIIGLILIMQLKEKNLWNFNLKLEILLIKELKQ